MPHVDVVATDAPPEEIIKALSHPGDELPRQAVAAARQQWETFLPRLLEQMRDGIETARLGDDPGDLVFWGVALLAERNAGEATQALPVLVEIAALSTEQIELLISDLVTEMLPQALANVAADQLELLAGMFNDPALDVCARWGVGDAILQMVSENIVPRERAVDIFHQSLNRVLEQHRAGTYSDDESFASIVVCVLTHLLPHAAADELLETFALGLVDRVMIDEAQVRSRIQSGEPGFERDMQHYRSRRIDDCLAVLETWGSFDAPSGPAHAVDPLEAIRPGGAVDTIERRQTRVGRNERCPCGSGRKYKKCCGAS